MPGDYLHIRVETCDGGPEAEHVFVIPIHEARFVDTSSS